MLMEQEHVFKALADEHRRTLLDLLFQQDGRTLNELCAHLPMMTRFGVMKHLQLLEAAGLVTTRRVGREKLHYLNPVPIQQVYDRWVSKFAQPITRTLSELKNQLEEPQMDTKPAHVFQIFIRTTPEKLWQALTEGDISQRYYFNTRVQSTWANGAGYTYEYPDGGVMITGTVLECDPPRKLVTTFKPMWLKGAESQDFSKVTYEITQEGTACKLTLTHENIEAHGIADGLREGWSMILSGLKSLLETGEALEFSNQA